MHSHSHDHSNRVPILELVVAGRPLPQTFSAQGHAFAMVPDSGGDYVVRVSAPPFSATCRPTRSLEFVLSVDGLSVLTGAPASIADVGYVSLNGTLDVPGWRRDSDKVAAFSFAPADLCYSVLMGSDAISSVGVVGVAVYAEKSLGDIGYGSPVSMRKNSDGGSGDVRVRGVGAGVGTAYGGEKAYATTEVAFNRGTLLGVYTLYYRTRQWLVDAGVPVPLADLGSAFPGDVRPVGVGAPPPPGWRP